MPSLLKLRHSQAARQVGTAGILTSSTTGPLQVLQDRGYVELRAKALRPLERGQLLSTMLVTHLGQFVEPAFTSRLEGDLDAISAGELDSTSFLAQWLVTPPRATRPYRATRPHL